MNDRLSGRGCAGRPCARSAFAALLLFLLAVLTSGAYPASLKFVPMSIVLDSEPRRAALTIINSGEEKVTLQLQLMKWSQDGRGQDVYEPSKDLVFYPQIVSIAAGKEGTVRVGFDQAVLFPVEKAYRLFVQELPVRKPGEKLVRIALRVGIPVFLVPKDPRPLLSYEDTRVSDGRFQVTFRNSGNAHSMIKTIRLEGRDEGGNEVFLKELDGWYVLPGTSRSFPVEVTREECRGAKTVSVNGKAGDVIVKGQFDVDAAALAQLAASGNQGKLDVEKLLRPEQK
jgi:fimbrial chaperone protein